MLNSESRHHAFYLIQRTVGHLKTYKCTTPNP